MSGYRYVLFDALFDDAGAEAMIRLCERFGSYGMYSQENVDSEIGRGLSQRHDSVLNFLRTGGRHGRHEPVATLAARTARNTSTRRSGGACPSATTRR